MEGSAKNIYIYKLIIHQLMHQQITPADTSTDKILMTCFASWLLRSMSASFVIGNFSASIITAISTSYTAAVWKQ